MIRLFAFRHFKSNSWSSRERNKIHHQYYSKFWIHLISKIAYDNVSYRKLFADVLRIYLPAKPRQLFAGLQIDNASSANAGFSDDHSSLFSLDFSNAFRFFAKLIWVHFFEYFVGVSARQNRHDFSFVSNIKRSSPSISQAERTMRGTSRLFSCKRVPTFEDFGTFGAFQVLIFRQVFRWRNRREQARIRRF